MPLSIALKENKNTLTYSGDGSLRDLDSIIAKFKKVLIFTDPGGFEPCGAAGYFSELQDRIAATTTLHYFPYSGKALPLEDIETIYQQVRQHKGAELIIAIGGGTVIDLAKVISLAYSNDCQQVAETIADPDAENLLDLLFIPTTCGTGSEGTSFAVVYKDKVKLSIDKKSLLPDYVVLDPLLLKSLPDAVLKSTVLDALGQAIEAIWARGTSMVAQEYASEAIELIMANVKVGNRDRLAQLQIASHLAGRAINISRTTLPHSISYPMTAHFGTPHGTAVFLTLPEVAQLNHDARADQLQEGLSLEHLNQCFETLFEAMAVNTFEQMMDKLHWVMEEFQLSTQLRDYGIEEKDLQLLADNSITKGRSDNNPAKVEKEDVLEILKRIY